MTATDEAPPPDLAEHEQPAEAEHDAGPLLRGATATYSPEDNKLRLYPLSRLSADLYARVKAAGFSWAPKQELFVAPAWTPGREDLLIGLCGEIDDEDKSLVERAEERAERFDDYSEKREAEAVRAKAASDAISDGIPFGQPILVGHHSERRARKDAEKIRNGMTRAVKLWETSKYWEDRAAGAIRHAKYKELPGVRARRIKTIEAEKRKVERALAKNAACLKLWESCQDLDRARLIAGRTEAGYLPCVKHPSLDQYLHPSDVLPFDDRSDYAKEHYPTMTLEEVKERARKVYGNRGQSDRWLAHYSNRIAYERAMLAEGGGLVAERQKMEPGGQVLRRGQWFVILKVNPQSVTVSGHFTTTIGFDEIKGYRPPTAEVAAAVAKATKLPPLCNYPGEGFKHMTRAELDAEKCRQWSDFGKIMRLPETVSYGAHRVQKTRGVKQWDQVGVYVTDEKVKYPPPPAAIPREVFATTRDTPPAPRPVAEPDPRDAEFLALKEAAKNGVKVVTAPNLFPTPPDVARQMVELADVREGMNVLEPSAGTGNLVRAILDAAPFCALYMVEINPQVFAALPCEGMGRLCADFLTCQDLRADFDRVVMNPPFDHGSDIKHVERALSLLAPGGKVVALVCNGPRQRQRFEPVASAWIDLPDDTFKAQGTSVRTAIVVIDR